MSIKIQKQTRTNLRKLCVCKSDTYDEILAILLELIHFEDEEGKYTKKFRRSLMHGMLDIRKGRTFQLKDLHS